MNKAEAATPLTRPGRRCGDPTPIIQRPMRCTLVRSRVGQYRPVGQPNVLPVVVATKTSSLRQLFATGCINSSVDVHASAPIDCEANRGEKAPLTTAP